MTDDKKISYADDTCLVFRGHDLDVLTDHINTTLAKVPEWCKFNELALNPSKYVYMLVTGKLSYSEPNLFIEDDAVKRVKNFFYRVMNVGENLKYGSHVEVLQKKFSELAGKTSKKIIWI